MKKLLAIAFIFTHYIFSFSSQHDLATQQSSSWMHTVKKVLCVSAVLTTLCVTSNCEAFKLKTYPPVHIPDRDSLRAKFAEHSELIPLVGCIDQHACRTIPDSMEVWQIADQCISGYYKGLQGNDKTKMVVKVKTILASELTILNYEDLKKPHPKCR